MSLVNLTPEYLKSGFEESELSVAMQRRATGAASTAKSVPSNSGLVGYWSAIFSPFEYFFFFLRALK